MSIVIFAYKNDLFLDYARAGKLVADGTYQFLVNNHGTYSYITAEQNKHLDILTFVSFVSFGSVPVVDFFRKKIFEKDGSE